MKPPAGKYESVGYRKPYSKAYKHVWSEFTDRRSPFYMAAYVMWIISTASGRVT